jgi:hypothetical protein
MEVRLMTVVLADHPVITPQSQTVQLNKGTIKRTNCAQSHREMEESDGKGFG